MRTTFKVLLPSLLLLTLPAAVHAQFTFTTNNGAITITGYTGPGGAVVIPSATNELPVTCIGDSAFHACTSLTSVTIPDSVTNIASYAFEFCYNLANVTLGNGVTSIGSYAFAYCSTMGGGLTSVIIPDSVTTIGAYAFDNCGSLTNITLGSSITTIGDWGFYGAGLTSLSIPTNVLSIGSYAFDWTSLTNVTIPANVTNLGTSAFGECSRLLTMDVDTENAFYSSADGVLLNNLKTTFIQYPAGRAGIYTIPTNVTTIGALAFNRCFGLASVTIPGTVTNIGSGAFEFCRPTNITIPSSVTSIGNGAFANSFTLKAIDVDPQNAFYSSMDGVLFDKLQTTLLEYPGGKTGAYAIPSGVSNIADSAFYYCTHLTRVSIPNSVSNIGSYAFAECTSLNSVTIGNRVATIGTYAFEDCRGLWSLYFTGNAPKLGSYVFYNVLNATVYYLLGTTGWGSGFGGFPTVLWNPQIQTGGTTFGVRTNRFGFTIAGSKGLVIVVEACTNLANHVWLPVGTNSLTSGSSYFSDPQWTNYPARLYRVRSP
jgi:hypothetical protein